MIEVEIGDLARAVQNLACVGQAIELLGDDSRKVSDRQIVSLLSQSHAAAELMVPIAKRADLDATHKAAERLAKLTGDLQDKHLSGGSFTRADFSLNDIKQQTSQIRVAAIDQLSGRFALMLSSREAELYEAKEPPFGPDVEDKFPATSDDIVEAGKCLALGRGKASVMHLMLAMETALQCLATKIGATVKDKHDKFLPWGVLSANLKTEIEKMAEGDPKASWWEVHAMLVSVGKSWRNKTMHPAQSYSEEQARKVYDAVKGFMADLAVLA